MLKRNNDIFDRFVFIILLPFLFFFISYYGFESSYTLYKNGERTSDYLYTSVYAYRLIPNFLSLYMTGFVESLLNIFPPTIKELITKNGVPFYHGLFLLNSVFFIISSVLIDVILSSKKSRYRFDNQLKRLIHLLSIFLIVITQYAPTNYDMMALSFCLLGCLLTFKFYETGLKRYYFILILIIVVSTFVRETSCLNIALFAAIFFNLKQIKKRNFMIVKQLIPLVLAFILPYLLLRKIIVLEETTFVEGFYIAKNFSSPFNIMGLIITIILFYFIYKQTMQERSREVFVKYIFFSLPYLMMIALVGLFWEIRLFLPLFLTGFYVILYNFKTTAIK